MNEERFYEINYLLGGKRHIRTIVHKTSLLAQTKLRDLYPGEHLVILSTRLI